MVGLDIAEVVFGTLGREYLEGRPPKVTLEHRGKDVWQNKWLLGQSKTAVKF